MLWPDDFIISKQHSHSGNGNGTVILKCRECLIPHKVYTSRLLQNRGQFCSKRCSLIYHSKRMTGKVIKLGALQTTICQCCGREFQYFKSARPSVECCSNKCRQTLHGDKVAGKKHPFWKGGRFPNWRGAGWQALRQKIRQAQDFRCKDCDKSEFKSGVQLDVHHITPYRISLRTVESKLVALCRSCHMRRERCL